MTQYQYGSLREKMAAESAERQERYAKFAELWEAAVEAGHKAAETAVPAPMVVSQHANQLDDTSPVVQSWYVSEGVCGFGWVTVTPGNASFAHWAKKHAGFRPAYGGGVQYWVGAYGQSYERKMAFARAAAEVLSEGLKTMGQKARVYAGGRLD